MNGCTVHGCTRPTRAKGLCAPHYEHQRYHGHPVKKRARPQVRPCLVDGCDADERVAVQTDQDRYQPDGNGSDNAKRDDRKCVAICEAAAILAGRGAALSEVAATIRKHPGWLVDHLHGHGNAALLGV